VIEFEKFLAPWEIGEDDKPLDEPADIDPGKLKKFLYGLLSDKEKLQETVSDKDTEIAQVKDQLTTAQREKETADERRAREDKEREERFAAMEKREQERKKLEAIEDHFKDKGITTARAKRLAARVDGDDERSWLASADELVEDGFRISEGTQQQNQQTEEPEDTDLLGRPHRVRRADGTFVQKTGDEKPKKSWAEQVDELIPVKGW
jgi:hypothetical protein